MDINFGLNIEEQERIQTLPEKKVFGAASDWVSLRKDGWEKEFLQLEPEIQMGKNIETMGCTGFGTNNILEMLHVGMGLGLENRSDRFLNKVSGTTQNGNTVDAPIDATRKYGYLLEEEWTWDRETFTWPMYYSSIPNDKMDLAASRVAFHDYGHEYIWGGKDAMCKALENSPLGVTVAAWSYDSERGVYRDYGQRSNHFSTIVRYDYGNYWLCGDTYPTDFQFGRPQQEFLKKLDWNFNFGCVKRYYLKARTTDRSSWFDKIKKRMEQFRAYMDSHGLHVFYVDSRGKQEIPLTTTAEKALFMTYLKNGIITQSSWPALSQLPDYKFF